MQSLSSNNKAFCCWPQYFSSHTQQVWPNEPNSSTSFPASKPSRSANLQKHSAFPSVHRRALQSITEFSAIEDGSSITAVQFQFKGHYTSVEFHPAPIKTLGRMREKISEYASAAWPLCANILDPVRCSIVCDNPEAILDVVSLNNKI